MRSATIETDEPARVAFSDKNGFFRLTNLPSGPITISVRHVGFLGTDFQLRLPPDSTVGIGVQLMPDATVLGVTMTKVDTAVSYSGPSMMLRVISSDSQPLVHASVTIDGGLTHITNEKGEISLGGGDEQLFTFSVRRLGYAPWFGKVEFPDSASVYTVALAPIVHDLSTVVVKGTSDHVTVGAHRILRPLANARERGAECGIHRTRRAGVPPFEQSHRHAKCAERHKDRSRQAGEHDPVFDAGLESEGSMCPMAILVDGHQMRDVILDQYLVADEVMGIEVYSRTGNTPISLHANNNVCGIIAIWTGSRKP